MTQLQEVSKNQEDLEVFKQDLVNSKDVALNDGLNTLQETIKDFGPEYLPMNESMLNNAQKLYADLYASLKDPNLTNLNLVNQTLNEINRGIDPSREGEFKIAKGLGSTDGKVIYESAFGNYVVSINNGIIKLQASHFDHINKTAIAKDSGVLIHGDGKMQGIKGNKIMNWKSNDFDPMIFVNPFPFIGKDRDSIYDYIQKNK